MKIRSSPCCIVTAGTVPADAVEYGKVVAFGDLQALRDDPSDLRLGQQIGEEGQGQISGVGLRLQGEAQLQGYRLFLLCRLLRKVA